jgi:hypothetical protein
MRRIPLWLARKMGDLAVRNRVLAVLYIFIAFYAIPVLLLFATGAFKSTSDPAGPASDSGSAVVEPAPVQ